MKSDLLFSGPEWYQVEQARQDAMLKKIMAIEGDQLLNTPIDDLVRYFTDTYSVDVPQLMEDRIDFDMDEKDIDVSKDQMRDIHLISTGKRTYLFDPKAGTFSLASASIGQGPRSLRKRSTSFSAILRGVIQRPPSYSSIGIRSSPAFSKPSQLVLRLIRISSAISGKQPRPCSDTCSQTRTIRIVKFTSRSWRLMFRCSVGPSTFHSSGRA